MSRGQYSDFLRSHSVRKMNDKFRSRKFALAAVASLMSHVSLPLGWLAGGEWIAAQGLILGLYAAANVAEAKVNGGS